MQIPDRINHPIWLGLVGAVIACLFVLLLIGIGNLLS